MKLKAVSGIMLTLFFIGMLTLAFDIQPTKSEPTTISQIIDGELSELPPDVKTELTGYLQVLSEGWNQDAVNSANAILSNTTYNSAAWNDFFSEYFSNNSFTDDLRNYLGYPVFWWFSDQVHYNLQEGLINPLLNITGRIFQMHQDDLSDALTNDPELLQTLMNTQSFLNYMVTIGVITEISKNTIFDSYKDLVQTYPHLLKKNITFDIVNEPYLATVRAQIYANIRDTLPLTSEIKNEITQSINLTGFYLEIWNNFSVLVLDNNGFDSEQLNVIYNTLVEIPSCLHNLGIITQNDLLGNTGEKYQWLAAKSGINIFNIEVGSMIENGFPDDVTPKYSDVFTLVLIHEINHVVDAYYISNNDSLHNRKMDLIEAAGNTSMNYLRSMFPDDFFITYPQEFFASISNQWFSDTFHTLELGLTRFSNGYTEPINQFVFFADIYSLGLNQTIFYTLDTEGNITKKHIPLTRDSNHHINSLDYNGTRYLFNLDDEGNVLKWEAIEIVPPPVGTNLLRNPDFEQQLDYWSTSMGTATYTADPSNPLGGSYSAKGVELNEGSLGRLYQDMTGIVHAGGEYQISGWIRTQDVVGWVVIALDYVDSNGWTPADGYVKEIGYVTGSTDWAYFESDVFTLPPMPSDATAIWFLFDFNNGKGTAWWDDVSLIEIPPPPPEVWVDDDADPEWYADPTHFATIQEGVDAVAVGGTVFVFNGTYYEHVTIDKSLMLIGENARTTIIDGSGTGNVILVIADDVSISGFTIQNSGEVFPNAGVFLDHVVGSTIQNNDVSKNLRYGIFGWSSNNTISGNNMTENVSGIELLESSNNEISGNNITNNKFGVWLYYSSNNTICGNTVAENNWDGIGLYGSSNSSVSGNMITANSESGVWLGYSSNYNSIYGNNITANNISGIYLDSSNNNTIYHNNFISNTRQVYSYDSINSWDDGYPSGGNYWSDYTSVDVKSGPNQDQPSSDGIGDIPYVIDGNNQDNYPLMGPFTSFSVIWEEATYYIDTVSNSTLSDFYFSQPEKLIGFNVTGPDATVGFCRVTIPKSILKPELSETWKITIDDTPPLSQNIIEDENYTYLYFTYEHSTHRVEIRVITEKVLLGTGWGWMKIEPRKYVWGRAELYEIRETQIELVMITYKGEEYSRTWNITRKYWQVDMQTYLCYSEEWEYAVVRISDWIWWRSWSLIGREVWAFGFA